MPFKPSYVKLQETGELGKKVAELQKVLESCELCPRRCCVNRFENEKGYCQMGKEIVVSSYGPHFGEEKVLVGLFGSGTIFLAGCNLLCVYCQNYEVSYLREGRKISERRTADLMLDLQSRGCHNINFVTPTHFSPQLVRSLEIAAEEGLRIPIVWNCGGYENVEIIRLLNGIVDIYMPDIKYGNSEPARKYSNAPDYFERCKEAVEEMHCQVGDLKLDKDGIAYRGLLIRHLVLPNNLAGSENVLFFIQELSRNSYINIMYQYRPEGRAWKYKELSRYVSREEFTRAIKIANKLGLKRLDKKRFRQRFL